MSIDNDQDTTISKNVKTKKPTVVSINKKFNSLLDDDDKNLPKREQLLKQSENFLKLHKDDPQGAALITEKLVKKLIDTVENYDVQMKKIPSGQMQDLVLEFLEVEDKDSVKTLGDKIIYKKNPGVPFPRFDVWRFQEEKGVRLVEIYQQTKTAKELQIYQLKDRIRQITNKFSHDEPCGVFCLDDNQIKSVANGFLESGRQMEWPKPVGFKSDPEYVFFRHDFDPAESATENDFPTISLNLKYISNSKNLCERIGSIFDPEADRKQVVCMFGKGDTGKTEILNLLKFVGGGDKFVATVDESMFKKNGMALLLNKRIAIGAESSKTVFAHPMFKRVTGGDSVLIDEKYVPAFNAELKCMFFFALNSPPVVSAEDGIENRFILCECSSIPHEDRLPRVVVQKRMRDEAPYFLRYCIDMYNNIGGNKTIIVENNDIFESLVMDSVATWSTVFDRFFVVDEEMSKSNAKLDHGDLLRIWEECICDMYPHETRNGNSFGEFKKYVTKKLGRSSLQVKVSKKGSLSKQKVWKITKLNVKNPLVAKGIMYHPSKPTIEVHPKDEERLKKELGRV